LYRDEGKIPRRATKFLASHLRCIIEVLGNEEKWKTRGLDVGTLAMNETGEATIIDDDTSSDESNKRSSTPHSVANTRRLVLRKKATKDLKGKKAGGDDIAKAMDRIANARLQENEDRKLERNLEAEAEVGRVAMEERKAENKERSEVCIGEEEGGE
jgi:hypothetical protein